jgi:hypothetical protein
MLGIKKQRAKRVNSERSERCSPAAAQRTREQSEQPLPCAKEEPKLFRACDLGLMHPMHKAQSHAPHAILVKTWCRGRATLWGDLS